MTKIIFGWTISLSKTYTFDFLISVSTILKDKNTLHTDIIYKRNLEIWFKIIQVHNIIFLSPLPGWQVVDKTTPLDNSRV